MSKTAFLFAAVVCNVGASLALKAASLQRVDGAPSWTFLDIQRKEMVVVLGALALYGLSFAAYMQALRTVQVSFAYPIVTGLTTLLLVVAAGPLFGEGMTAKALVGIGFVLIGSYLLLNV